MRFSTKPFLPMACFTTVVLLTGCNNTLDFRNAEISNNKIYSHGANTGFSGKVTNVPLAELPAGKIAQLIRISDGVIKDGTLTQLISTYAIAGALGKGSSAILCDVAAHDGVVDGDAICTVKQTGMPIFNLMFNNGALNGKVAIFDLKRKGTKIAEAVYSNGELNGQSEVFSASNGKTLHKAMWVNGVANGAEEAFDATTGNRILSAMLKDGKYDGEMISYSADGKIIDKKIWNVGVIQAAGHDTSSASANLDGCINQWASAYQKEKGDEAAATNDQISEWEIWCKQGKTPTAP